MQKIEISDSSNGFLSFDLKDILRVLPPVAAGLAWHILALEAVGHGLKGQSMLATESQINSNPHGLRLRFQELEDFAAGLEQTVNAVIIGLTTEHTPPSLPVQNGYHVPCIIIEAIDSSLWTVSSNEDVVIRSVLEHFERTTVVVADQ